MRKSLLATFSILTLVAASAVRADDPQPQPVVELNEKEQAFQEMLTGTRLTGSFTVVGREQNGSPKEESYEIQRLTKLSGDFWIFLARAKWGNNDVTLPFMVKVVWADDTPMISLTDAGFRGLGGKFGCRVVFHDGRYAGTWNHDQVGGHMYGTIAKLEPKPDAEPEKKE